MTGLWLHLTLLNQGICKSALLSSIWVMHTALVCIGAHYQLPGFTALPISSSPWQVAGVGAAARGELRAVVVQVPHRTTLPTLDSSPVRSWALNHWETPWGFWPFNVTFTDTSLRELKWKVSHSFWTRSTQTLWKLGSRCLKVSS